MNVRHILAACEEGGEELGLKHAEMNASRICAA